MPSSVGQSGLSWALLGRKGATVARRRELSTDPGQVKVRIRRKIAGLDEELERLKPVEEWDWEELQRGYPKRVDGKWGARPRWADLYQVDAEVQRRLKGLTRAKLGEHVGVALDTLVQLMQDDSVDLDGKPATPAATRLKAAEFILDQTIGKATSTVAIEPGEGLQQFLAACMVNDDGEDAHPITLPGEVLSDDEDEIEEI